MKLSQASTFLLLVGACEAFAPTGRFAVTPKSTTSTSTQSLLAVDPHSINEIHSQFQSLQDVFSTLSLSDADTVAAATDAAGEVAKSDNGWFGFLTGPITFILEIIHSLLVSVGLKSNAWGVTIVAMTLAIKIATFPLTKTQLESTNKMQAMQPAIKELQAKYQSNPEVMNQKIAEFYQANDINPLAGCLPSLAQIPIFIGLYRGVLDLAKEDKLNEPFLWLPNLEGPVYGADVQNANAWLFQGWQDGVPALGWDDTIAFLILPVFLVVSQYLSMELMQPKSQDPAQQQSNAILKFLPLMIGWFSLNVPAALCIYWVTNNIVTTATSLIIRNSMSMEPVATATPTGTASISPPSEVFAPSVLGDKPAGFGDAPAAPKMDDGVTPITSTVVDAEVVEADAGEGMGESSKKRGGKKKKKRRKN